MNPSSAPVEEIAAADLVTFWTSSPLVVWSICVPEIAPFNSTLPVYLSRKLPATAKFGWTSVDQLVQANDGLAILHAFFGARRIEFWWLLMPGTYLFKDGAPLAWHPAWPGSRWTNVLLPAGIGAIGALLFNRPDWLLWGLKQGWEQNTAEATGEVFLGALNNDSDSEAPFTGIPNRPTDDDLRAAYLCLGVDAGASDTEVHRAWRQARRSHHPDLARDEQEAQIRHRTSIAINRAYDCVRRARGLS